MPDFVLYDDDDLRVTIDENSTLKEAIADKVLAFFQKHGMWSGEQIMQSDAPQIDAPRLLSEIADEVLHAKVVRKDVS